MEEKDELLETTKEVEELNELERIEEEQEEIIEEPRKERIEEIIEKKSLIDKFKSLSPKKKILFIIIPLVIILIILFVLFFLLGNDEEDKDTTTKDPAESIVIEKDNYIYEDGKLTILKDEEEVGVYECTNKDENLCYVAYINGTTNLNKPIYVNEADEVLQIPSKVYDKYVFVFDNAEEEGLISLIDLNSGEEVAKYQTLQTAIIDDKEYLILQSEEGIYGLYDSTTLENLITEEFTFIDHQQGETNLVGYKDKEVYIIDNTGKILTPALSGEVKDYNDEYITTLSFNNYRIIDYKNESILENMDYVTIEEDYYTYVDGKRMFIDNYDGVKYLGSGIELIKEDLTVKYIFSETNELIKEEFNYKTEKKSDEIKVTVASSDDNLEYDISLKEGEVSKNLSYHSYYDGVLYFYGNAEKTQVLGSYSCKNENSLEDNKLDECYPAEDAKTDLSYDYSDTSKATYTMPIVNNKYVFIQDGNKIALYDLGTKTNIAYIYDSVNIVYDEQYPNLQPITVNHVDVIATNDKLKFGVIELSTSVNPVYSFDHDYISRLNTGYALQKNGSWEFVNDNGNRYPNFPGVIKQQSDSYLIVENNNEDFVYDLGGNKISDQGFEYLHIDNNLRLFAGIKNNKIYVYETNGTPTSTYGVEVNIDLTIKNPISFKSNLLVTITDTSGNLQDIPITMGTNNAS